MLDGYAGVKEGHHLNINVFNRETLMDAMVQHPIKSSTTINSRTLVHLLNATFQINS